MYNLSPRKGLPLVGSTPKTVGPSTYILCGQFVPPKKNPAPFLSTSKRNTSSAKKPYTDAFYSLDYRDKIPGGSGLQSKSQRCVYRESDTPGPADYDAKKPKCQKLDPTPIPGRGKLYVCRVPYTLKGSGPSIPTHADQNGYTLDLDGDLIKLPPDEHDTTLGPAFYKIPTEPCLTSKLYRGCRWSVSKSKRSSLPVSTTPGPGAYDVHLCRCLTRNEDDEFREMARLFGFVPRYSEQIAIRLDKECMPGPGSYNPKISSFDIKPSTSVNPVPFITGAKRFVYKTSGLPAPNKYTVENYTIKPKRVSKKRSVFGFNALRFPQRRQTPHPAPCDYEIKGPIEEKLCSKLNPYAIVRAPFNQTSRRKIGFVTDEDYMRPGPDEYTIETNEKEPAPADGCVFRSQMVRFPEKSSPYEASPASYDVTEPFKRATSKESHNAGEVPFLCGQNRSSGFLRTNENPGPGDYAVEQLDPGKGYYFSTTARFTFKEDENPGPGTYTLNPIFGQSIYKAFGTHNLRLKENVCRCKLRFSPEDTHDDWLKLLLKKKKLRWFSRPTSEYRHCVPAN